MIWGLVPKTEGQLTAGVSGTDLEVEKQTDGKTRQVEGGRERYDIMMGGERRRGGTDRQRRQEQSITQTQKEKKVGVGVMVRRREAVYFHDFIALLNI